MRKRILAFVFGAALLVALALPLFGGVGTAQAIVDPVTPSDECSDGNGGGGQAVGAGAIGGPGNEPDGRAPVNAPVPGSTGVPFETNANMGAVCPDDSNLP